MLNLKLNRKMAQLALLQRIELANPFLSKLRKTFGRYLFSKVFSKYFINLQEISKNYYTTCMFVSKKFVVIMRHMYYIIF